MIQTSNFFLERSASSGHSRVLLRDSRIDRYGIPNDGDVLFIPGAWPWRGPSGCARAARGRSPAPVQAQHRRVHRAHQGGVQLPAGAVPQVSERASASACSFFLLPPFILIIDSKFVAKLHNSGGAESASTVRSDQRGVRFCRSA